MKSLDDCEQCDVRRTLTEQLAAERESSKIWESIANLRSEQLAEHIKAANEVTDENIELEQQLAAERKRGDEALDWARNIQQDLRETKQQLAAEREKVQPLVDALRNVEAYLARMGIALPEYLISEIERAQVKEGKE